ncbi:MAG: aminoglycoside phosphotransferase family protein [Oscillospiraceae bacterium]|nr:aminoglycoside phosphotransferase family protein [Oscillospiraceae bacterium]
MLDTIKKIGETFRLPGEPDSYDVITNGNINATYRVTYRNPDGSRKNYIFQRINTTVFSNPVQIMQNIDLVTTHIRTKYPNERTLHFHHTAEGKNYISAGENAFWRVMNWVDSITFDTCDDLSVIEATGAAFGRFQNQLSDFDGAKLFETIPDFHNTKKRLDTLFAHVAEDPCGRVSTVQDEIAYIESVREKAGALSVRYANGEFPVRVTHNDTKSNNVLFDRETKMPIVVIDLDTVMPGMAMYDFGDAVRFIANTAAEDEPDLQRVSFDTAKFRAFCKGFIGEVVSGLTQPEIDSLVLASFSITIELASRFLDDYITGDKYFKVNYPEHNLVRTRCQLALAKDILRKQDALEQIVRETVRAVSEK